MQEKWLIASDLDGTLFQVDHQISSRTLEIMHMMINQGHSMVLITGRSSHSAIPRLLSIPEGVRIICSNGAYEYDQKKHEIVWAHYISAQIAADIRRRILRDFPSASFGWESTFGLAYESKFVSEAGGAHTLEQGGIYDRSEQHDVLKIFVRTPGVVGAELAAKLSDILLGEVEVSSSGAPFAEITAVGVNKGSALAKVAFDLGIESKRTLAFGDNQNDSPMLRWAGTSVAMANAIEEVKELADIQTLSNSEDGVAYYLESKF
jgi:Cof subfamily protein (haloacid dehalogenase superfamily)